VLVLVLVLVLVRKRACQHLSKRAS